MKQFSLPEIIGYILQKEPKKPSVPIDLTKKEQDLISSTMESIKKKERERFTVRSRIQSLINDRVQSIDKRLSQAEIDKINKQNPMPEFTKKEKEAMNLMDRKFSSGGTKPLEAPSGYDTKTSVPAIVGPKPYEPLSRNKFPGLSIVDSFLTSTEKHRNFFVERAKQDKEMGLGALYPLSVMAVDLLHPIMDANDLGEDAFIKRIMEKFRPPNNDDELGTSGQAYERLVRDAIMNSGQIQRTKFLKKAKKYIKNFLMDRIKENSSIQIPVDQIGEKKYFYNQQARELDFSETIGDDFNFEFSDDQGLRSKKRKRNFVGNFGLNNEKLANLNIFEKDVLKHLRDVFGFTGKKANSRISKKAEEIAEEIAGLDESVNQLEGKMEFNQGSINGLLKRKATQVDGLDIADETQLADYKRDHVEMAVQLAYYENKKMYYDRLAQDIDIYSQFKKMENLESSNPEITDYRNRINAFMADSEYVVDKDFVSEEMLDKYLDKVNEKVLKLTNNVSVPISFDTEQYLKNNFHGQYEMQEDLYRSLSDTFGESPMQEEEETTQEDSDGGEEKIIELPFDLLKNFYAGTPLGEKYNELRAYSPERLSARQFTHDEDPDPGTNAPIMRRKSQADVDPDQFINPDDFDPKTRNMLFTLLDSVNSEDSKMENYGMDKLLLSAITGSRYHSGGYYSKRAVPTLERLYRGRWHKRDYIGDVASLFGLNDISVEILNEYLKRVNDGMDDEQDHYTWETFLPRWSSDPEKLEANYNKRVENLNKILQVMPEKMKNKTAFGVIGPEHVQKIKPDPSSIRQYADFKELKEIEDAEEDQSKSASQEWLMNLNNNQKEIANTIGLERKTELEAAFAQNYRIRELWDSSEDDDIADELQDMVYNGTIEDIQDHLDNVREKTAGRLADRKQKLIGDTASFYKRVMSSQRQFDKSGWLDTFRLGVRKEIRDKNLNLGDLARELSQSVVLARHMRHALNKFAGGNVRNISYDNPNRRQQNKALSPNVVAMNNLSYMIHLLENKSAAIAEIATVYQGDSQNAPFWKKYRELTDNYSKNIQKMWGKRNSVYEKITKTMDPDDFFRMISDEDSVSNILGGQDARAGLSAEAKKLLKNYKAGISRDIDKELEEIKGEELKVKGDEAANKMSQFIGANPQLRIDEHDSRLNLPAEEHEEMAGILTNVKNNAEAQRGLGEVDVKTREYLTSRLKEDTTDYDMENTFNSLNQFAPNAEFLQDGITYLGYVLGNHKLLDKNVAEESKKYLDLVYPEKSERRAVLHRFGEFILDFLGFDQSTDPYSAMNTEAVDYNKKNKLAKFDKGVLMLNSDNIKELMPVGIRTQDELTTYKMMRNIMLGGALLSASKSRPNKFTDDGRVYLGGDEKSVYGEFQDYMNAFVGANKMKVSRADLYAKKIFDPSRIANQYVTGIREKQEAQAREEAEIAAGKKFQEENEGTVKRINKKAATAAKNIAEGKMTAFDKRPSRKKRTKPKRPLSRKRSEALSQTFGTGTQKTEPAPSGETLPPPQPKEEQAMQDFDKTSEMPKVNIPKIDTKIKLPKKPPSGAGGPIQLEAISFKGLQTKPKFGNMAQNQKPENPMKKDFKDNIRRKMTAIFSKESSAYEHLPDTGEGETTKTGAKLGKRSYMFDTKEHGFEDTWGMWEL